MPTGTKRPVVLIIRDGWGSNPHPEWNHANAVFLGNTPVDDRLMAEYPHALIRTCGEDVGLPAGIMGNSEVGHQNIGAGRIVDQEIMRISRTIRDGSFFENPVLNDAFAFAAKNNADVHIIGLCSDAGVHSALEHLDALIELAQRKNFPGDRVFIHAFGDGRDSPPESGVEYLQRIEAKCTELGAGRVASVVGRYYAMDRDNRWDRVETAYHLLTEGQGRKATSAEAAYRNYYANPSEPSRHGDEFIEATAICPDGQTPLTTIQNGDAVIFFNYRGDRPRELTRAFTFDTFPYVDDAGKTQGFDRPQKLDLFFATMTGYEQGLPVQVIFEKPPKMENIFGQCISDHGLKQFRIAETEKYPHVTFFFNDYRDAPFPGEDWKIIPSPRDVTTYDQKPQMSALEVTDEVVDRINSGQYDTIILNYANGDMVGHTANIAAAVKAVETVDACVGRVVKAVQARGGALIVTADHGNCEQLIHPDTGGPHTAHTTYDVECIVVDDRFKNAKLRTDGRLADIAPTALHMIGLDQPAAMTGQSLLPRD
jgi:2,3-bisphosphoglycerate-independent phosphoglycerate mutase